ncbi:AAC(3)-I family aminoglycoside N-acetyltransferase [Luteimonas sp. e5]
MANVEKRIVELRPQHVTELRNMLDMFATVFADPVNYAESQPTNQYLHDLLARDTFIAVAAVCGDEVIGGLTGYVLHKFEQARKEIYIYDLAVIEDHRRCGIASRLIRKVQEIATRIGAYVIFVQADYGDDPAVSLYTKLGTRENVMHFDIDPEAAA